MSPLSNEQKQLLFDHCMGVASEQQEAEADALIASNSEAARFCYEFMRTVLTPLECLEVEACPDFLADRTIERLREKARSQPSQPDNLSEIEQGVRPVIRLNTWRSSIQIAAIAAIVLFLLSVALPSFRLLREKAYQSQCQVQLADIYKGLTNYVVDHDGPPTVVTVAGDPWWKVGYQGKENHSNTRVVWLLARNDYVQPESFICPARQRTQKLNLQDLDPAMLNDFPSRDYIDYSFRVSCDKTRRKESARTVLMADLNPLSEKFPVDYSKPFKIRLDETTLNQNSVNHRRQGQNVLLNDGSVGFRKSRLVSTLQDDIFTLQDMTCGSEIRGCEIPSCESDAFLAP